MRHFSTASLSPQRLRVTELSGSVDRRHGRDQADRRRLEAGQGQNNPEMVPSSSISIPAAAGSSGSPGSVSTSSVRTTRKPAPAAGETSCTSSVQSLGAPF